MGPTQILQVPSQQRLAVFLRPNELLQVVWQVSLVQGDAGIVEEKGLPGCSWTSQTRSFLAVNSELTDKLETGRRKPPAVTPSAVSGMVLRALCWRMIGSPWCWRLVRLRLIRFRWCWRQVLRWSMIVRAVCVFLKAVQSQRGRRAAREAGAGFRPLGRRARAERGVQRAEAGSRSVCSFVPHECDTLVAVRVESPSSRVQRVFDALHGNAHAHHSHPQNSPARSLHGLHDACCVENSHNSLGEGAARGRGVCVPG